MLDPHLPSEHFSRDAILGEEVLFQPSPPRRFSGGHPLVIPLRLSTIALTEWDSLILGVENHSQAPVCLGLRLEHHGEPPPVSLTGGREWLFPGKPGELFFPRECFGSYGRPHGWAQVRQIKVVVRRERDLVQPTLLDISVVNLRGRRRRRPPGPRLTEQGLKSVFSRDLAVVPSLGEPKFTRLTDSALAVPPPIFPYRRDTPAEVLSGRIMGRRVGFPPDWSADPFGELEWQHFLHRHHFLRPLVRALIRTGQPKYAQAIQLALSDWILAHPSPMGSDGGAGPAWETLSVAFRLREWLTAIEAFEKCSGFKQEFRSLVWRSLWEHARHLMDHRGHPGNWRLLEAASLALIGMSFPGFNEAETWAETGLIRLEQEVSRQFMPDGLHVELSPLYHSLCSQACLEVREKARSLGRPVPAVIELGLPKWFRAGSSLSRPDFTRPAINDSGGIAGNDRALLRYAGKTLPLPEALWVGSMGRRGNPPVDKAFLFSHGGLAVLRTGYDPQSSFVLFRTGPAGAAHRHEDDLSLEFMAKGRLILVDPGISRYAPSSLTDAYRRAEAHCTILVDRGSCGANSNQAEDISVATAGRLTLINRPNLQVVMGTRLRAGLTIMRAVALVAGKFLVVRDAVQGTGRGTIRVHWQCGPGLDPENTVALIRRSGVCQPIVHRYKGDRRLSAGFVSVNGRDVPAVRLDYTFEAIFPALLHWVIWPDTEHESREITELAPEVMVIRSTGGPALRLDLADWDLAFIPRSRTSG